ncbi:MAG: hydantoinase/oxoprolinase family protein [Pseudomonadota bacterium]
MIRSGADIGGTFTDVIVFDSDSSSIKLSKTLSSKDLSTAVLNGLSGTDTSLADINVLVHGSTVVINALLERKGVTTALLTTKGFRDVYEIGRINRPDSFNVFFEKHTPLVPRALRFEVNERLLPDRAIEQLTEAEIARVTQWVEASKVDSVAILFLHSFVNPAHERALKSALTRKFPDKFITASYELTREYREYERSSTVVANAYVGPIVDGYLGELERELEARQFAGKFYLMQSNGGLIGATEARSNCISLIESGPAGGVIGSQQVLRDVHFHSGVAFDMGGTTAKAGVVEEGQPRVGHDYFIGSYNTGLPILTSVMDIHEVGTGGGSIASVTDLGELRVGPQSAGAHPGPACYARGGKLPTVTDANVVLGRLNAELPLAGELKLDIEAAQEAIRNQIAARLDVTVEEAALGIIRVANTAMAYAISAVTIERGLNPADFVLIAYGGAGPLHATQIARELGMGQVVIPPTPGVFSAYGMLFADPQGHAARTKITGVEPDSIKSLAELFDSLTAEAVAGIGIEGESSPIIKASADMRYVGQEHTVNVPIKEKTLRTGDARLLKADFDVVHERTYSHSAAEQPAQVVTLRVVASVPVEKPGFVPLAKTSEPSGDSFKSNVHLDRKSEIVSFYAREDLIPGQMIAGPAVIFESTSSTLLIDGDRVSVHDNGHLIIEIESQGAGQI